MTSWLLLTSRLSNLQLKHLAKSKSKQKEQQRKKLSTISVQTTRHRNFDKLAHPTFMQRQDVSFKGQGCSLLTQSD